MDVEVLGVLEGAEVGEHGCSAVPVLDIGGDGADGSEQSLEVARIIHGGAGQRADVQRATLHARGLSRRCSTNDSGGKYNFQSSLYLYLWLH